jgi:branched-chain amino acid aminotransferase
MGFFASVNGTIASAEEARVSILDNGFTFGDSVYETLRTYGGRPFHVDRHLARLRHSASRIAIDIPWSDHEFTGHLDALLDRAGNEESYIRLIVTRGVGDISYHFDRVKGPTIVMAVKPYEPLPQLERLEGVPVAIVSIRRNSPQALDPAIKSCNLLNNILAVREAQSRGAVEAILLNERGEVSEGASSNIFAVSKGVVTTPPLEAGILPGITRDVILERAPAIGVTMREGTLLVPDVLTADEVFITSTLKEAAPVSTIDGRPVRDGRPGPITLEILQDFRAYAPLHSR